MGFQGQIQFNHKHPTNTMLGQRKNRTNKMGSPTQTVSYEGSPTKASKWIKADCSEYVNNLSAKKQNYKTALDLYRTCFENELPQKCLKHLNFITLYCADQRKLLCVNCLYGSTMHKNHSVTPSNQSQPSIKRDNQENLEILEQEINNLKDAESQLLENKRVLEGSQKYIMQEIDREFAEMYKILEYKHKQVKERALIEFETTSSENKYTIKQVGEWKQKMQEIRGFLPKDNRGDDSETYKHLVMELILGEQLQAQKLTYMASREDMEQDFLAEVRDLKETLKYKVQEGDGGDRSASRKLF